MYGRMCGGRKGLVGGIPRVSTSIKILYLYECSIHLTNNLLSSISIMTSIIIKTKYIFTNTTFGQQSQAFSFANYVKFFHSIFKHCSFLLKHSSQMHINVFICSYSIYSSPILFLILSLINSFNSLLNPSIIHHDVYLYPFSRHLLS